MPPLKVCLVASEIVPFAKTGGLADVTAAIGRYLHGHGHDVRLLMPMYRGVREGGWAFEPVAAVQDVAVRFGERRFTFSISTAGLPESGAPVHFVRCPELYDRDGIYTSDADEHLRFAMLARACLLYCQWTQWAPDVIHCNDWHTGLLPFYLKHGYSWDRLFHGTRTVLTIHNIGYQGRFSAEVVPSLELSDHRHLLYQEDLERGELNFLKTGLLYADVLTTVSETYAREIQGEELGMGLHELLRRRSDHLVGIVNGVDYAAWDPERDRLLPHHYSARDLSGKRRVKQALLERLGLPLDAGVPVFGIVSRMTGQKGFELLPDILAVLLQAEDLRLVVLGSGEERYERYFDWLGRTFPTKCAFRNGYDEELAHWIEAGSDAFVMPSRYEPCGLNQMYSLRYGTVPIVRRTGGLADTVQDYDPASGRGTGFVFDAFTADALYHALRRCLETWRDRAAWERLMRSGMAQDFSWERQGRHYVALYERLKSG